MSAIAGIFYRNQQPATEPYLRSMTSTLAALGPGSETFWLHGNVGFGHRLRWFTREDKLEIQPLTSGDGRFTLVGSARIDNRAELGHALRISSADARVMPDSAFIAAGFEAWGEACLRRLIGSFALAVYDHRERSLLLARDPRGDQSLYYWADRTCLVFASAPKALFALGFIPRKINLQRAADHLVRMPHVQEGSSSWYQGVVSIEPGSATIVTRDGIQSKTFWRLDPHHRIRYPRDSDYVDAFSDLWERVVSEQTRSHDRTGVLLSGGLDSTAVAATAAPFLCLTGQRLAAFTEIPPAGFQGAIPSGWYADETPYVRAMARKFKNIDLNFISTENRFLFDGIEEYFAAAEAPVRAGFNRLWVDAICSTAASQGVRVLLTGQGGNLTISWYGSRLLEQLLKGGRWITALGEAQALVRSGVASSVPAAMSAAFLPFLPGSVWSRLLRARHPDNAIFSSVVPLQDRALITPEFAQEQRILERARESNYDFRFRPRRDIRTMVLGPTLGEGDMMRATESRFGVQLRSPAADPRIVEFCLSIPEEQFLRNGTTRWLIRRAMRNRVPDEILDNRSRGYQSAAWIERLEVGSTRLNEELENLERSPLVRHVIDLPRLRALLSRLIENKYNQPAFFKPVIGTSLMMGRFLRWTETGT